MSQQAPTYRVRRAQPSDPPRLPAIEAAAGQAFAEVGLAYVSEHDPTPEEDHEEARVERRLWVVVDDAKEPVGFALMGEVGGVPHLEELAVHPEHGRRGLGRRLVDAVCESAAQGGHTEVTLTTFRDVPWNAPYYARMGFERLEERDLPMALAAVRREEDEAGLPARDRVCMRRALGIPRRDQR